MGKLKLENGSVALQDGNVVWINDDGKEQAIDIGRLMRQNTDLQKKVEAGPKKVRDFMLKSALAQSEFLKNRSVLPSDIVMSVFGDSFQVEEDNAGFQLVGMVDSRPLFSRQHPGQYASPDEVLETLFERRADKDQILKKADGKESHSAPSGPKGNADNNAPTDRTLKSTDKISAGLKQLKG